MRRGISRPRINRFGRQFRLMASQSVWWQRLSLVLSRRPAFSIHINRDVFGLLSQVDFFVLIGSLAWLVLSTLIFWYFRSGFDIEKSARLEPPPCGWPASVGSHPGSVWLIVFLNCWTPHHQRGKGNSKSPPPKGKCFDRPISTASSISDHPTHTIVSQYIRLCGFRLYAGHELFCGPTQKDLTTIKTYYIYIFFLYSYRFL